jgi:hypothetical protein
MFVPRSRETPSQHPCSLLTCGFLSAGCMWSSNPLFAETVVDVACLYHDPPDKAVALQM